MGSQRLRFSRAVIATGGRPTAPPIPGLDEVAFFTNETIFALTTLPRRLLIIGAGPIGCELEQAFARFGSAVSLFDQAPRVLPRDDADAAAVVQRHLESARGLVGARSQLGADHRDSERDRSLLSSRRRGRGARHAHGGDALLVAAGRAPNIEGLHLDGAGIEAAKEGVVVDDRLQTTHRRVYASGDVCSAYKFTHAADALSRIVLHNALFFGRRKASAREAEHHHDFPKPHMDYMEHTIAYQVPTDKADALAKYDGSLTFIHGAVAAKCRHRVRRRTYGRQRHTRL